MQVTNPFGQQLKITIITMKAKSRKKERKTSIKEVTQKETTIGGVQDPEELAQPEPDLPAVLWAEARILK